MSKSTWLVQLMWLSEFELTERQQKKIEQKTIKLNVFLGFEPFLLSNCEAERRIIVPKPQV